MNSGGTNSDDNYEASKDDGFETQSNASSSHNNEHDINKSNENNSAVIAAQACTFSALPIQIYISF